MEARRLEYDNPRTPKPRKKGTPASIILLQCSSFLESSALDSVGGGVYQPDLARTTLLREAVSG